MPIQFLFDEHLRGYQWEAFQRWQLAHPVLRGTRVGDPVDLPLGTPDELILEWAETNDHIVLSADVTTMPGHFRNHLVSGRHLPGLFLVAKDREIDRVLDYLALVAEYSDPEDWRDKIEWVKR